MRCDWGVIAVAAAALLPRSAHAQATHYQATIAATAGVTDNASALPVTDGPTPAVKGDFFAGVEPTLAIITETRRLESDLDIAVAIRQYKDVTVADTRSLRGHWSLSYVLDPTWRVIGNLGLDWGKYAGFEPLGSAAAAVATGGGTYVDLNAGGSVLKDFSPSWRGGDTFLVTVHRPLDDTGTQPDTLSLHNGIDAQYSWKRDAGSLGLNTDFHHYVASPGVMLASGDDALLSLTFNYIHELSPWWGLILSGGGGVDVNAQTTSLTPLGHAALTYQSDLTTFEVGVSENVAANTLLATTLVTSEVDVTLTSHPLAPLNLRGLLGASRGSNVTGGEGTINTFHADALVSFAFRENLAVELSYTFIHRIGDTTGQPIPVATLTRSQGLLGLRYYFPNNRPANLLFVEQPTLRVRQSEEWDITEGQRRK